MVLALGVMSCSRQTAAPANSRIVWKAFDDQTATGEPWLSPLLSTMALYQLNSHPEYSLLVVEDMEGVRESASARMITGTIRRAGQGIELTARLTDVQSSTVVATVTEVAPNDAALPDLNSRLLTRLLGAKISPLPGKPTDWLDFGKAAASHDLARLEAFVQSHADFSPAYLALGRAYAQQGRRTEVASLLARYPQMGDPLSRAQLKAIAATTDEERLNALAELVKLRPNDVPVLRQAGTLAESAGNWPLAASFFRQLSALEPGKGEPFNSLAYAEARQGHLPEAVAAMQQYQKLSPDDPNVYDSLGEIHYMSRKFTEAANYFEQGVQRYPMFQGGVGRRKAAFAYYHAGNLAKADQLFGEWLKQAINPQLKEIIAFEQAMWLVHTGRPTIARQSLAQIGTPAAAMYLAAITYGLEGKRPTPDQLRVWATTLVEPNQKNDAGMMVLLLTPAPNEAALAARINSALPQPQLAGIRTQLLATARQMFETPAPQKPAIFPLPNNLDSVLDALVLRARLAVIR